VSSIDEAVELRRARIEARILNTGWTMPSQMATALDHDVDVAVLDAADVAAAGDAARRAGRSMRVHWKIDTGMGRLGTRLEDVGVMRAALLSARTTVDVAGLFTHFASADEVSSDFTAAQHERFLATASLVQDDFGGALLHCANSAAALLLPQARHDIIRPGIALYGYPPVHCRAAAELRPALRLCAVVAQVKEVGPGESVGYGREWVARQRTRVATIAAGYADGIDRRNANRGAVIAGGAVCPMIGRISMDQLTIDATGAGELRSGDTVTLMGEEGGHTIDAAAIARSIGTISYEVLCAVPSRVPRMAVNALGD
jgi:alanine racemase